MGSKPTEGRAANNASTRVEILKSAAIAFRRLGYHGATVEQIAAALQMKKGNLYYYYKNKEEILLACHQYSLDRLLALLEEVEQSDAAPDEKLRRLIVSFVHTILDELHGTALFLDLEALTAPHRKLVIARRDQFDHGMRRVIEDGVRTGVFGTSTRNCSRLPFSARSIGSRAGTSRTALHRVRRSPIGSRTIWSAGYGEPDVDGGVVQTLRSAVTPRQAPFRADIINRCLA